MSAVIKEKDTGNVFQVTKGAVEVLSANFDLILIFEQLMTFPFSQVLLKLINNANLSEEVLPLSRHFASLIILLCTTHDAPPFHAHNDLSLTSPPPSPAIHQVLHDVYELAQRGIRCIGVATKYDKPEGPWYYLDRFLSLVASRFPFAKSICS